MLMIIALLEGWRQSGPQSLRWIDIDRFGGFWSLSESNARGVGNRRCARSFVRASICLSPSTSIRALVLAHVAHMLKVAVTDPGNPDYHGIPDGADDGT